nr:hypothetical protein [Paenibacillus sp. IHB B 3084]
MEKKTIYFLCTDNSCRSQMAEGSEEEKWGVFQRVRDQVGERIKQFAEAGE